VELPPTIRFAQAYPFFMGRQNWNGLA
jgi:hypothetical protein